MILTEKKINDAILKAKCCLASKTIKYFNQLSYGKDDMNLFKCINVLDISIEILSKFKIVGSTSECCCTIEGTYLIEELNILIQFNSDGTGYVNGQAFTWFVQESTVYILFGQYLTPTVIIADPVNWPLAPTEVGISSPIENTIFNSGAGFATTEDFINAFNSENNAGSHVSLVDGNLIFTNLPEPNQQFLLLFSDSIIEDTLTSSEAYTFNFECDENGNLILDNFNNFWSFLSELNNNNPPLENTDITLSILDNDDVLQDTVTVSSNSTPEEIVNQFNEENTLNLVMQYTDSNTYQVYSPLYENYTDYTFTWNQVEAPFTALLNILDWGSTSQTVQFTDANNDVYTFSNPGGGDETTFMLLLEAWLETQPFEMTVVFNESVITFSTSDPLFYGMQPSSVQLTLIEGAEETNYDSPFTTNVVYEAAFQQAEELNLINQEKCTPETVEQTCLSNKQIGDIINYINKTCTDC